MLALLLFLLEKQILEPLLLAGNDDHDNHKIDTNDTSTRDSDDVENGDGGDAWKEFAKGVCKGCILSLIPLCPVSIGV